MQVKLKKLDVLNDSSITQWVLLGFLNMTIVILLYTAFINPMLSQNKQLYTKARILEEKLQMQNNIIDENKAVSEENKKILKLMQANHKLEQPCSFSCFMQWLSHITKQKDIKVLEVVPKKAINHAVSVKIEMKGGYHNLAWFYQVLIRDFPLIKINNLIMKSNTSKSKNIEQIMSVKLFLYNGVV